eukprot:31473-Pelagococcus_subviridis.AAC.6
MARARLSRARADSNPRIEKCCFSHLAATRSHSSPRLHSAVCVLAHNLGDSRVLRVDRLDRSTLTEGRFYSSPRGLRVRAAIASRNSRNNLRYSEKSSSSHRGASIKAKVLCHFKYPYATALVLRPRTPWVQTSVV